MVNLIYLVHVGCHLDRHVIGQASADAMAPTWCRAWTLWATTGRRVRTGRTDGREHVPGANMYRAPTCTERQHVGRQHVPGANFSGANMLGANLTPFSQKTPQNCHFLLKRPKWIFKISFFALSTIGSCPTLLGEHVQKISQNLTARIVR
jgi:hypothetical protein